jgi:hypothetical protein
LFERTRKHLETANNLVKIGVNSQNMPQTDQGKMYAEWIRDGLHNWCVFPLELLPNGTRWDDVRLKEQQWIDRFLAKDIGLNVEQ